MDVKLISTGEVIGQFEGLTSSPIHDYLKMGITVVKFRDSDGIPYELPANEVSYA